MQSLGQRWKWTKGAQPQDTSMVPQSGLIVYLFLAVGARGSERIPKIHI